MLVTAGLLAENARETMSVADLEACRAGSLQLFHRP
jgi:hypothetical protein